MTAETPALAALAAVRAAVWAGMQPELHERLNALERILTAQASLPTPGNVCPLSPGAWIINGSDGVAAASVLSLTNGARSIAVADAIVRALIANADLVAALKAAQEELRLIRMKDHGTVYNPALSTQIALALQKAESGQ